MRSRKQQCMEKGTTYTIFDDYRKKNWLFRMREYTGLFGGEKVRVG